MFVDWLSKWSLYSPEKLAVKEASAAEGYTYKQLNNISNGLCLYFKKHYNLEKANRIFVLADFHQEYFALLGTCQKAGFTMVPANYRLSSREIDYLLHNSEPSLIIVEDKYKALIAESPYPAPALSWEELGRICQTLAQQENRFDPEAIDENDAAFILYSSGTTGTPKGVLYTHKMMAWNGFNTSSRLQLTAHDITLNVMPPFHTGGWNVLTTPLLQFGGTTLLMPKFEADKVMEVLQEEDISIFMVVPTMLKMMADSQHFEMAEFPHLKYFIVGGEALPLPVIEKWAEKNVLIRQGYGLTEVGPNVTSLEAQDAIRKRGSIGFVNFYLDHKLVKENGEEATSNEAGELWLKGEVVTPGYWKNESESKKSLVDGWFRTGDMLRKDEEGYLYVVDRIKNMYISGGENVYPAEIEKYLITHPSISEVAIVGVPDSKWGESGKAFVVLKAGATLSETQVIEFAQKGLAKFKVPKSVAFLNALPKNDSGKIDKKALVKTV